MPQFFYEICVEGNVWAEVSRPLLQFEQFTSEELFSPGLKDWNHS